MNNSISSFRRGWQEVRWNKSIKQELTTREISERFPYEKEDAFFQGMIDGLANDRFRYDLQHRAIKGPKGSK